MTHHKCAAFLQAVHVCIKCVHYTRAFQYGNVSYTTPFTIICCLLYIVHSPACSYMYTHTATINDTTSTTCTCITHVCTSYMHMCTIQWMYHGNELVTELNLICIYSNNITATVPSIHTHIYNHNEKY